MWSITPLAWAYEWQHDKSEDKNPLQFSVAPDLTSLCRHPETEALFLHFYAQSPEERDERALEILHYVFLLGGERLHKR